MSLRAKLCAKKPATNSETSPSRCRPRLRSPAVGASSASDISTTSGFSRMPSRRAVIQGLGAREERQQVDDVVLGLVLDRNALVGERGLQRIAEELPQVRHVSSFSGVVAVSASLDLPASSCTPARRESVTDARSFAVLRNRVRLEPASKRPDPPVRKVCRYPGLRPSNAVRGMWRIVAACAY